MLHIVGLEQIQELLLQLPGVLARFQRKDPGFVAAAMQWLSSLEEALESNRLTVAASVAVARAAVTSAERGITPPGLAFHGRPTKRRILDASAVDALRRVEEAVSGTVRGDASRVAEAQRLARQVVALATLKGILPADPRGLPHRDYLSAVWRRLAADPEMASATVQIVGLVSQYDALIVLDRAMADGGYAAPQALAGCAAKDDAEAGP